MSLVRPAKLFRNCLTNLRFSGRLFKFLLKKSVLQNLHFADNRKDNKTDKAFKMKPVIDHLNLKFSKAISNDSEQTIAEHMVKFKGRSGMKQYIKSKPIKWGFLNSSFCCSSKSGCLYQMDIYLGRKQTPEFYIRLEKK